MTSRTADRGKLSTAPLEPPLIEDARGFLVDFALEGLGFTEPANGFEDRGAGIHNHPQASAHVRFAGSSIRSCPSSAAVVHQLGCHLGCQGMAISPQSVIAASIDLTDPRRDTRR